MGARPAGGSGRLLPDPGTLGLPGEWQRLADEQMFPRPGLPPPPPLAPGLGPLPGLQSPSGKSWLLKRHATTQPEYERPRATGLADRQLQPTGERPPQTRPEQQPGAPPLPLTREPLQEPLLAQPLERTLAAPQEQSLLTSSQASLQEQLSEPEPSPLPLPTQSPLPGGGAPEQMQDVWLNLQRATGGCGRGELGARVSRLMHCASGNVAGQDRRRNEPAGAGEIGVAAAAELRPGTGRQQRGREMEHGPEATGGGADGSITGISRSIWAARFCAHAMAC